MVEVIRQIALDALDLESLSDYVVGFVTSAEPLTIQIENGPTLTARFLILSEQVTEQEETGKIRTWTETEGDRWSFYRMIREKGLQEGERVILAKAAGGQQYMVLDRVKGGGV